MLIEVIIKFYNENNRPMTLKSCSCKQQDGTIKNFDFFRRRWADRRRFEAQFKTGSHLNDFGSRSRVVAVAVDVDDVLARDPVTRKWSTFDLKILTFSLSV